MGDCGHIYTYKTVSERYYKILNTNIGKDREVEQKKNQMLTKNHSLQNNNNITNMI